MAARFPCSHRPIPPYNICTVEMLQDEKADDSGRPLFAVQGGMRGHNSTKEAADSHVSVSTGSE